MTRSLVLWNAALWTEGRADTHGRFAVTLAMGFDSGPPGASAAELIRMVDGGLTTAEGLAAATTGSAAAIGTDEVGAVEPERSADLIVVDGDPASDVRVLGDWARIWLVLRDGRPVAGTVLESDGPVELASEQPAVDAAVSSSPCLALLSGIEAR